MLHLFLLSLLGPLALVAAPLYKKTHAGVFANARGNVKQIIDRLPLSPEHIPQTADILGAVQGQGAPSSVDQKFLPYRNWDIPPPEIDAYAAFVVGTKSKKIFYERNMREKRPIASLTKLATALVAADEFGLEEQVAVSRHAVNTGGDFGNLVVGEVLRMHDLLRAMLVASSNDAAVALSEHLTKVKGRRMTELMNAKAYALALTNTHFSSVSGLEDRDNYSSAEDVAKLFLAAIETQTLGDILKTASVDIASVDGRFTHRLVTSNKLMNRFDGVVAGKTGFTSGAGGTLAVLAKNPKADDDFIVVVLGSANEEMRFTDAEALINWVNEAYHW